MSKVYFINWQTYNIAELEADIEGACTDKRWNCLIKDGTLRVEAPHATRYCLSDNIPELDNAYIKKNAYFQREYLGIQSTMFYLDYKVARQHILKHILQTHANTLAALTKYQTEIQHEVTKS